MTIDEIEGFAEGEFPQLTDEQIDILRDGFFELANNLNRDIPRALHRAEEFNTVEPIVYLFEKILGSLACLCATASLIDDETRIKFYNCEGCLKRKHCEFFIEHRERKEAEKQGLLFEFPVIISDEKH